MSRGYSDNLYDDVCWRNFFDEMNEKQANYYVFPEKYVNAEAPTCKDQGLGTFCFSYGPGTSAEWSKVIERESWMRGLGQVRNKCPQCDGFDAPPGLFDLSYDPGQQSDCYDTSLQQQLTRYKKSCDSLTQVDTTEYWAMPTGQYQPGYTGADSVQWPLVQETEMRRNETGKPVWRRDANGNRMSYGAYRVSKRPANYECPTN